MVEKNKWIPFGKSVMGASHSRRNPPYNINQDSLQVYQGVMTISEQKSGMTPTIAAVSDGHGSNKYIRSNMGSKFAVEVITDEAKKMLQSKDYFSSSVRLDDLLASTAHIKARFLMCWQNEVDKHYKAFPFTDDEKHFLKENCSEKDYNSIIDDSDESLNHRIAYGCTFLAAIAYPDVIIILQYGDGDVLGLYENGNVSEIIEPDPQNFGNQTLSLCTLRDSSEIQHRVLIKDEIPILITLSTDGVKNSFDDTKVFYKISKDIKTLLEKSDTIALSEHSSHLPPLRSGRCAWVSQEPCLQSASTEVPGFRNRYKSVEGILEKELQRITTNGSGDDVTLGVLFDNERI